MADFRPRIPHPETATLLSRMKQAALKAASAALAQREKGQVQDAQNVEELHARWRQDTRFLQARKSDGSMVTSADLAAQDAIEHELSSLSGIRLLGEEDADVDTKLKRRRDTGKSGSILLFDPLDGTRSFLAGQQWAVILGHEQDGNPTCSVIYVPSDKDTSTNLQGTLYEADMQSGRKIQINAHVDADGNVTISGQQIEKLGANRAENGPHRFGGFTPRPGQEADFRAKYSTDANLSILGDTANDPAYVPLRSAGADMMATLEGGTYAHGYHSPWDTSGKLILARAGLAVIERESSRPGGTLLIAGDNAEALDKACTEYYAPASGRLVYTSRTALETLFPVEALQHRGF